MKSKHILVVEDETPLIGAIVDKLTLNGHTSTVFRSVEDGLSFLSSDHEKVDAIWLDHYLLGKENGIFFTKSVKANKDLQATPIFVVSNTGGHEKKKEYKDLGVTQYFVKSEKKLDGIVQDILNYLG